MKEEGRYFGIVPFLYHFGILKRQHRNASVCFDFGIFGIIVSCRKNVKIQKNKSLKKLKKVLTFPETWYIIKES